MNLLFVCTGNTCRSPMAEGIMNAIAAQNGLDIHSESAGLFADGTSGATDSAVEAVSKYGVDISSHVSRPISPELIEQSDLILTMTPAHQQVLENLAVGKVFTLSEYAGVGGDIEDPYGGERSDYEASAKQIYDAVLKVAERIGRENDG